MTPAKNIRFPAPASPPAGPKPAKTAPFTRLDNATDMELLAELPNALLKPALCLLMHRNMRPVHWGEVATYSRRGATQTRQGLARLAELGLAVAQGDLWSWAGSTAARKPVRESARKPVRKSDETAPENAVQDGETPPLKEGTEVKKKEKTNNTYVSDSDQPAPAPTAVVAGGASEQQADPTQQAQSAAPGGARADLPSPSQLKTAHQHEETENVTDSEKVPPPAAAPQGYRAAQEALAAAGAWDIWQGWVPGVPGLSRNRAAQDAQIAQFATWVQAGLVEDLRQNARDIVVAGSFAHPFPALVKRMERAEAVQHAQRQNLDETRRAFGEATCMPGERRRAPDGRVWTVEAVEYGMVFFAESGAPLDVPDRVAAEWEVEA
ncbi:hypothetical protein Dcar01_03552 [Deinococcus carri]|uniref:Uncharacterized protein n=1 Tax=Deinococcus carri TaxID=1211323 RepID=A0ABP9WCP4_9DEIO